MRSPIMAAGVIAALVVLPGCGDILAFDNYDPPTSVLTGRVVFQGQPIGVRNRGVQLELWEPAFELNQKIPVNVRQDGSFRAVLFDGEYELNLLPGNGPWLDDPTRIPISLRGEAHVDVEVKPYYTINNEQIDNLGGRIEAVFDIGEVNTSRSIEYVGLYVATTQFVDRINQRVRREVPLDQLGSIDGPVRVSVDLPPDIHVTPSPAIRKEVFVRVGIKIVGVSEMIFSPIHRVGI